MGLGYALCASELLLGPVVPSNTARGGGIMAPIVGSLARALGSEPDKEPRRAGEPSSSGCPKPFTIQCVSVSDLLSCLMISYRRVLSINTDLFVKIIEPPRAGKSSRPWIEVSCCC